jgi:hypothetical protein
MWQCHVAYTVSDFLQCFWPLASSTTGSNESRKACTGPESCGSIGNSEKKVNLPLKDQQVSSCFGKKKEPRQQNDELVQVCHGSN